MAVHLDENEEQDFTATRVKSLWDGIQDAQHAGRVQFPPWSPPVLNHDPSQRLHTAPIAQPINPAAMKKDAAYYWYRQSTGSFSTSVTRSICRWPGPIPGVHLPTQSRALTSSRPPERLWAELPRSGDVAPELRRLQVLEHRALCHQRYRDRQAFDWDGGGSAQFKQWPVSAVPSQRPWTSGGHS